MIGKIFMKEIEGRRNRCTEGRQKQKSRTAAGAPSLQVQINKN